MKVNHHSHYHSHHHHHRYCHHHYHDTRESRKGESLGCTSRGRITITILTITIVTVIIVILILLSSTSKISACYHQYLHHVYHERRVGEVIGDTTRGRFRGTRGHQTEGARLASVNQIFVMCVKIVRFQGPGLASVISFEIIYQDNKNLVLETTLFLYII